MRWIGSSDAYKARICRQVAKRIDYNAEFSRLEREAKLIQSSGRRPAQIERMLEQLRNEWRQTRRQKIFAETGVTVI